MIKLEYSVNLQKPGKFVKKPLAWINFENVINDPDNGINDRTFLCNKYGGRLNKTAVSYSTPEPENSENPKTQAIITAYGFLESTNRYEMPSLQEIMVKLNSVMDDSFTQKDVDAVDKTTDDMYVEFMQKIQEPKVQELLKSMGQYHIATTTYGWKRSMDNVLKAYAQKPDATFVQTRYEWFHRYNREIVPNATRILLVAPKQDYNCSMSDILETMRSLGYDSNTNFMNLSTQQQEHIKIVTIYHTGRGFEHKAYYDISDTVLIPGKPDIWADEAGFDNNFTGHLNQKAMDDVMSKGVSYDGVDASEIYNREEGNPQFLNAAIVKGITNKYPEVKPITNGNPLMAFENNVKNLANYLLETKSKIVRQENRDLGVKIITAFVLAFSKLQPNRILENLKQDIMSREAYLELRDRINDIMRLLNNSMIKRENYMRIDESLPYLQTLDQMFDLMGIDPTEVSSYQEQGFAMESKEDKMKTIKESFMKTLNRLNEHKYYNEKYEK